MGLFGCFAVLNISLFYVHWSEPFGNGSWVNVMVREFSQWFVGINAMVRVFTQWFVGFRKPIFEKYVDFYCESVWQSKIAVYFARRKINPS